MKPTYSIPVVDLNDYLSSDTSRQLKFIDSVGTALTQVGFFALTNHGLNQKLIDTCYTLSEKTFDLDIRTKCKYENPPVNGQRGYISFAREHAKGNSAPDLKEFWQIGQSLDPGHALHDLYPTNIWPTEIPRFKDSVVSLFQQLERCALLLLEACALFAGGDKNLIRDMAVDGNHVLRLIHYPPIPQNANPSSIRAAAHEDINLITLLISATSAGLEILDRENRWLPVITPDHCVIVDSGDMLQNLSNGFYKSTTHRVSNPDNPGARRFSMPFFVHARDDLSLSPLPLFIEKTGHKQRFPDITAGAYLQQRLQEIGLADEQA